MNTLHLKGLIQEIKQSEEKEKLETRIKELSSLSGEASNEAVNLELHDLKEKLSQLEIEESKRAEKSLQEIFLEYYPYIRKCTLYIIHAL